MKSSETDPLQVLRLRPRVAGTHVGSVVSMDRGPVVDFPGNPLGPQMARVVASLSSDVLVAAYEARLPVLLVFEENDPARPVILDVVIEQPSVAVSRAVSPSALVESQPRPAAASPAAWLGTIIAVEDDLVQVRAHDGTVAKAVTAVVLRNLRDPVLVVDADDRQVIVGQVYPSVPIDSQSTSVADVVLRGARITIEAETELTLRSGACVVHLDARGKAVTTAESIVSRARGTNKVQGGSVHLN